MRKKQKRDILGIGATQKGTKRGEIAMTTGYIMRPPTLAAPAPATTAGGGSSEMRARQTKQKLLRCILALASISGTEAFYVGIRSTSVVRRPFASRSLSADTTAKATITEPSFDDGKNTKRPVSQRPVPKTMPQAIRVFFFSGDCGPTLVVALLAALTYYRATSPAPFGLADAAVSTIAVFFWCFQEHFLHRRLLHSKFDWIGKRIHETEHHRNAPYFHVSIEPAPLLIGWMVAACLALKLVLPAPLAFTAGISYSAAGLWYAWTHFLVHTRVRLDNAYWRRARDHHVRHHLVDERSWFAFVLPQIDALFGTDPTVAEARKRRRERLRT